MQTPQFSVIIPALNEEKYLPHLLDSLAVQTEKNFEVIVVDGSSKDKTVEVAEQYVKKIHPYKIVISKKASLPLQRNIGVQHASGEWLLFLDADDILLPHALERCHAYIRTHPAIKFFTSWFIPDKNTFVDVTWTLLSIFFVESAKNMKRQIAPGPFIAVQKNIFEKSKGFEETRDFGEDQEFSMRLFEQGVKLEILRESLYVHSLRRFRKEGALKMIQIYSMGSIVSFLTKRAPRQLEGYIMGGHIYNKKKDKSKLQKILKELFD